jgi:dTMP kinase
MQGKFIAIEGSDGSGKETQQKYLIERLQKEGYQVSSYDFPQYETSFFGKTVGEMLSGKYGDIAGIHPKIAAIPLALDRFSAKAKIVNDLDSGLIVVANRYTLSNEAHQTARLPQEEREEFIAWVRQMEHIQFGVPVPDLYIYLNVPVEVSRELITLKTQRKYLQGGKNMDLLEDDISHQIEAAKMYKLLAETIPSIVNIDCCVEGKLLKKEDISERIWKRVDEFLGGGKSKPTFLG